MIPQLVRRSENIWELPTSFKKGMKVPVNIFASQPLVEKMEEAIFEQASNVASLPGLVGKVVILPDAHSGYGAPIGCVFATDPKNKGIISPGAVGYDINCGMRLLTTNLKLNEVKPSLDKLINSLFNSIPAGVGRKSFLKLSFKELDQILLLGARYIIKKGFGWRKDLENIEEKGFMDEADPEKVSQRAKERGIKQLATLGSGNHYLEIQKVDKIFESKKAGEFGIFNTDQIGVMFHCGSRGLGHQVASDYLRSFEKNLSKHNIEVFDKQLVCAPFESNDGQNYFQAMKGAVNFAFANRQAITHRIRQVFEKVFQKSAESLDLNLVYDVAHNIAKVESHKLEMKGSNFKTKDLVVHRKGATRSFPNLPVIIGGSMETGSYLLVGNKKALEISFGSTAHGSGRAMSRSQAKKMTTGYNVSEKMKNQGIMVKSASYQGLAEEAGFAYKNIDEVIDSVRIAEIALPVASFKPIGNIKG